MYRLLSNGTAGGAMLAMDLGFMGPNYPIATACATGNYCILRWAAACSGGFKGLQQLLGAAERRC